MQQRPLFFNVRGPLRHGNGSFHFKVAVHEQPKISGQVPTMVAWCDVDADDVQCVVALAEALRQVASQLPPPLVTPDADALNPWRPN